MKIMGKMLSLGGGDRPRGPEAAAPKTRWMPAAKPVKTSIQGPGVGPLPAPNSFGLRRAIVNRVSGLTWKMDSVDFDPVRRIAFYFALAFLFARFSFLAEAVSALFKISLYMN